LKKQLKIDIEIRKAEVSALNKAAMDAMADAAAA